MKEATTGGRESGPQDDCEEEERVEPRSERSGRDRTRYPRSSS